MESIQGQLSQIATEFGAHLTPQPRGRDALNVHIEWVRSERKPLLFTFSGRTMTSVSLSLTRASILLTLLVDLTHRLSGNTRRRDLRELASRVARVLSGSGWSSPDDLYEQIRVGFYRGAEFWEKTMAPHLNLHLNPSTGALDLPEERLSVDFTTEDQTIKRVLSALGYSSFIQRLRQERIILAHSGASDVERMLLDIYSLPGHLTVHSIYNRPGIISLPTALARKYASPLALQRYELMHERLKDGTLTYNELVAERELRQFIARESIDAHSYVRQDTIAEHEEHIGAIQRLLLIRKNYSLVCFRNEAPFYVGLYRTEDYSMTAFYQLPASRTTGTASAFFCWGESLRESAEEGIISRLLLDPATERDPSRISALLGSALESSTR